MKITSNKPLNSQQLAEKLTQKTCCGKEMILAETHEENSKVCFKLVKQNCFSFKLV